MMFRLFIILLVTITKPCSAQITVDLCDGGNLKLLAEVIDGDYSWYLNNSYIGNGDQQVTIDTGVYTIELVAVNESICSEYRKFTVIAVECRLIYMPNAFTPNGDGLNDEFGPIGNVADYLLTIYNQWGAIIYSGHSPWPGNSISDLYAYQLIYNINNIHHQLTGKVQLVQ